MPDHDYIPGGNSKFNIWQDTFTKFATDFMPGWNLDQTALNKWQLLTNTPGKKKKRWEAAWKIAWSRNCKKSDKQELKDARKDYERGIKSDINDTGLRPFIAEYIRYNTKVTNEQKRDMGLTVRGDWKTESAESIAASDKIDVSGSVAMITHLIHKNVVRTVGSKSRAKGKRIEEIQVYIAFTEAKVKVAPPLKEFKLDGIVFRGIYIRQFKEEDEGLRAWYYARKVIKGRKRIYCQASAPWSGLVS